MYTYIYNITTFLVIDQLFCLLLIRMPVIEDCSAQSSKLDCGPGTSAGLGPPFHTQDPFRQAGKLEDLYARTFGWFDTALPPSRTPSTS